MIKITPKQERVLGFISQYIASHKQSPTIEEIRTGLKFQSKRSVTQYLEVLAEKGYLRRGSDSRSIELIEQYHLEKISRTETIEIPLFGMASCGTPMFYADHNIQEYISVDKSLIRGDKGDFYFVRASGSSMNKEISDESLVLIEKRDTYDERENVLVVIDGKATIKKLFKGDSAILLMPSSTDDEHKPIIARNDFLIAGKVICSIPNPVSTEELQYVKVNE